MPFKEPFKSIFNRLPGDEPSQALRTAAGQLVTITEENSKNYENISTLSQGLIDAVAVCHGLAVRGGWWNDPVTGEQKDRNDGELIALMHSELSEALEALRKDRNDDHLPHRKGVEVELADTLIRIFDYAGARNLDLAGAVIEKLTYNASRADHKPAARAQADGKKF